MLKILPPRASERRSAPWATDTSRRGGAAPEAVADEIHYPATYVAGVYNRLRADVGGRSVENESLVNAPNWICFSVRPALARVHVDTAEGAPITVDIKGVASTVLPGQTLAVEIT